jgi:hypothetical protein
MPITYNISGDKKNLTHIYRATSGGTVFSANLTADTAFDLFTDTAVANDCIYFGTTTSANAAMSDLYFDVGTALAGTDVVLVWEYYSGAPTLSMGRLFLPTPGDWTASKWRTMEDVSDDTVGFTVTGANTVKFPIQMFPTIVSINGVTATWIRCRIVSLTAITEGGANQTTRVQHNLGRVYVEDYTEEVPCTFLEVYDWLVANQPHISVQKGGLSFFDFKKVSLVINSPLFTSNETIEMGNWNQAGGGRSAKYYLYYVRSGVKTGDRAGIDGSNFILYSGNNDDILYFNTNSLFYGSRLLSRGGYLSPSGYPTPDGEFIDCNIEFNGRPDGTLYGYNNKWVNYGTYIMSGFWNPAIFIGNKFILTNNKLGLLYTAGWNAKEVTWSYRSTVSGLLFAKNQTSREQTYNFYDCTPLPKLGATPLAGSPTLIEYLGSTIREMDYAGRVFFYDSTAGTFTDYTAAIKTGGAGNVPIHGEVGDCLYWYDTTSTYSAGHELLLTVPAGQTSNDYEYVWEYWSAGAWRTWGDYLTTRVLDRTNNFTKSDNVLLLNISSNYHNTTINAISASWKRLRIVTKGTGTPVITTMRHYSGATWCNDWAFKEWYSLTYKIIDEAGTPIENATVLVKDKNGLTVLTKTTDSDGLTETDYVNTRHMYFDDEADLGVSPQYWGRGKEVDYNDFSIYISKTGYETYFTKQTLSAPTTQTVTLKKAVPLLIGVNTGKEYLKLNSDNIAARELVID